MKKAMRFFTVAAIFVVLFGAQSSWAQVTVILTRHAEKGPDKDPPLTESGHKRARLLASMLADSGVNAIYVTEYQRTQQTAAPLAEELHVKPTIIPTSNQAELVKEIRARQSGVVLVVGHTSTLPALITALGGPTVQIPETQYDNFFVLTLWPNQSSLFRMHYGSSAPSVKPQSMKDMMPVPVK